MQQFHALSFTCGILAVTVTCTLPTLTGGVLNTDARYYVAVYKNSTKALATGLPTNVPTNVTTIDLSYQKLSELVDFQFSRFSHLLKLRINRDTLDSFSPLAFDKTNIEYVDFSYCTLTAVMPDLCVLNGTLQYVDIMQSIVATVPKERLQCLVQLRKLSITLSELTHMPAIQFLNSSRFQMISVTWNKIPFMSELAWVHMEDQTNVVEFPFPDLSLLPVDNHLLTLSVAQNTTVNITGDVIATLTRLHISFLTVSTENGLLEKLQPGLAHSVTQVVIKGVRSNMERVVNNLTIPYFPRLSVLRLNYIPHLRDFPDITPINNTLRQLFIYSCIRLSTPPETLQSILGKMTDLRHLLIQLTNLTSLPDLSVAMPGLLTLTLRSNPIICDCKMAWMKRVQENTSHALSVTTIGVRCSSPPSLAGRLWDDITLQELTTGDCTENAYSGKLSAH